MQPVHERIEPTITVRSEFPGPNVAIPQSASACATSGSRSSLKRIDRVAYAFTTMTGKSKQRGFRKRFVVLVLPDDRNLLIGQPAARHHT
jgi:hypothetical protein